MRVQILFITVLISILAWGGSYHVVKTGYHVGQRTGVVPYLQIKHRVHKVADIAWDVVSLQ
jgi:hypothetical protein